MRGVGKVFFLIASVILCQAMSMSVAYATTYTATQVDTGTVLRNNNGALVKQTYTSGVAPEDSSSTVTVTSGGKILATYQSPAGMTDHISAINDTEALVGYRGAIQGNSHALLLANGVATDLHAAVAAALGFDAATSSSVANDINNSGTVVGYVISPNVKAFQYKDGVVTDLGAVAGVPLINAKSINNFGQILVQNFESNRMMIYSNGVVETATYSDVTYGPLRITPFSINDAGQVMGFIEYPTNDPTPHATPNLHLFLYEGGRFKDVSGSFQPSFYPTSMNNTGAVVGGSTNNPYAALYKDGLRIDLTDETDAASRQNHRIIKSLGINDDGVILADAVGMIVLLTPNSPPQLDSSIFNFESGLQGWESNGEPIISTNTSTAQKFAGEKSLAMQFNAEGFASVRVTNPSARPGDTVTFHVFIPATSKIDWIQPFAQAGAGDGWAWYGNWTPIDGLQLGAWNTITVSIPADAHSVSSIGLEAFASQSNPGTVYLDSVDYGVTPDTAQYNFETGVQGWHDVGAPIVAIATSAAQVQAGRKSLALNIGGAGLTRVAVSNPAIPAGRTVTFNVYLPSEANIDWIQPFAQESEAGGWAWHGNWQAATSLQAGAWNSLTVDIPAGAQAIDTLGIEVSTSQSGNSTLYIDSVSY